MEQLSAEELCGNLKNFEVQKTFIDVVLNKKESVDVFF